MASTNQYLEFVLDLLGELDDVAHRKMMGEYVLYYRSKVVGGIYDDRFLLKVTPASERLLPEAPRAIPYEGAKEMLLVEVEDRDVLRDLVIVNCAPGLFCMSAKARTYLWWMLIH